MILYSAERETSTHCISVGMTRIPLSLPMSQSIDALAVMPFILFADTELILFCRDAEHDAIPQIRSIDAVIHAEIIPR